MSHDQEPDRSSIISALKALPQRLGVERDDLPKVLGPVLRKVWHVEDDDEVPAVRVKVNWHLERLIDELDDASYRDVARYRFNLTPDKGMENETSVRGRGDTMREEARVQVRANE